MRASQRPHSSATAAFRAEEDRREAAPIEKQQYLVAAFEVAADQCDKRGRQAVLAHVLVEIDDSDRGHAGRADPVRHCQQAVSFFERVAVALERRRRRREHDGYAKAARAHDDQVTRGIAKSLLLLVGRVVLLVDDDESG